MNTIKNLLINLRNLLVCACELFRYALIFLLALFSPKAVLAARLPAVKSRLAACLWHNLTYYPIAGNPGGLLRHKNLIERAAKADISLREWIESALKNHSPKDNCV